MVNTEKTSEKIARQLAQIRHKRVRSLKNRIGKGRYRISNVTLAKALILAA